MNISLQWLGDFLPGEPLDPYAVADALLRGGFPVERIEQVGDDTVLDVEVTSNRGDCLSHAGVAREIAALMNREFRSIEPGLAAPAAPRADSLTSVRIEAPSLCPHYTARVIHNVKIGPSPQWLLRRLEAVGLRAINNVVDVTNYVMYELGQPLHAFDFDRLAGGRIIVRQARAGEKLLSLDGHERTLMPGMLVIADSDKPVALAGVMGGAETEVSQKTTRVLLESARFDPLSVRRTARALAMKSDSSYRFERGIDPLLPPRASLRAAQLILETAGGELLSGIAEAGSSAFPAKELTVRLDRLGKLLGVDIPADEAIDALRRLQLSPQKLDGAITVTVPSWRLDLKLEVDLIEEVARVIGYERIPVRDQISIVVTPPDPAARALQLIRSTLVAAGFYEAVTFSFVSDALAGDFLPPQFAALPRADAAVRKADAQLRPSLLPGLLESLRRNEAGGTPGAKLFEIGAAFGADAAGKIRESRGLALLGGEDVHEMRGAVEALLGKLDAARELRIVPDAFPGYAGGAGGRIEWGRRAIGHLGRIEPKVLEKLSLREAASAAEMDLAALLEGAQHVPQLRPLPRFPAVRRDLTLDLSESVRYEQVEGLIRRLDLPFLEDVAHVTTYRGKPLQKGTKSLTATLIFRSPAGTLSGEQVEESVQKTIDAAKRELGAALRQ